MTTYPLESVETTDLAAGREPRQSRAGAWPPEVVEAGAALLRALAKRAAARGNVYEMLDYLSREQQLLTAEGADVSATREAPHG